MRLPDPCSALDAMFRMRRWNRALACCSGISMLACIRRKQSRSASRKSGRRGHLPTTLVVQILNKLKSTSCDAKTRGITGIPSRAHLPREVAYMTRRGIEQRRRRWRRLRSCILATARHDVLFRASLFHPEGSMHERSQPTSRSCIWMGPRDRSSVLPCSRTNRYSNSRSSPGAYFADPTHSHLAPWPRSESELYPLPRPWMALHNDCVQGLTSQPQV